MVIALTHMRVPNDQLLAASVPEFDLVLGGHDHERWEELVEPHGVQLIKSGELAMAKPCSLACTWCQAGKVGHHAAASALLG